jgi:hypothetical protein
VIYVVNMSNKRGKPMGKINKQGKPVGVINKQGKPVGKIGRQGEPAEKYVMNTFVGIVGERSRVVTNTEEESVKFIVREVVEDRSRVVTKTEEEPFNNTIVGLVGGPDPGLQGGDHIWPTSGGTRSGLQVGGPDPGQQGGGGPDPCAYK